MLKVNILKPMETTSRGVKNYWDETILIQKFNRDPSIM